jgi:hypothetical protein
MMPVRLAMRMTTRSGQALVLLVALAGAATPALAQTITPAESQKRPIPAEFAKQAAPDARRVLYNVANALGVLRGVLEVDSVQSIEFWGSGTMTDEGREYKLTKFYGGLGYDFPGMRLEFDRASGAGAPQHEIQVVSGTYAGNEDKPGAGLVAGYGTATSVPAAVNLRLLHMWMLPLGIYKAAVGAGANVKISMESGRTVLTFPLTEAGETGAAANVVVGALKGTPMKVTLDAQNRPARVEARYSGRVHEATYSDYADLNEKDNKADIFFPARIVQTIDGKPVLTLTVEKTNTYNPYVIIPVPESVRKR